MPSASEDRRMPRFLAVYTMRPEDLARFRSLSKPEQNAIDAVGLKQWANWEEKCRIFPRSRRHGR
jgi:hypothetical protein